MGKRLSDHLNSSYFSAANRLRSKEAKREIIAYVESYDDIIFWRNVLSECETDRCVFKVMLPSRDRLTKGKKSVLMNELGSQLGRSMIACVDADYDYLMQDASNFSEAFNRNPYIFHTYVYAIENFQCYAKSLHEVCVMATLNDENIFDFEAFLKDYSAIIYPLFVWSVWMYRHHLYKYFSLMDFCNIVGIERFNYYRPEEALERLSHRINQKVSKLQRQFPEAKKDYTCLKEDLNRLGVNRNNTYLYMQGHSLMDNVVMVLLEPVCRVLRHRREVEINRLAEHATQRQNELSCYDNSLLDLNSVLRRNFNFRTCEAYHQMVDRIHQFVDDLMANDTQIDLESNDKP